MDIIAVPLDGIHGHGPSVWAPPLTCRIWMSGWHWPAPETVRQLHGFPAGRWLRAEPRCGPGEPGPHRGPRCGGTAELPPLCPDLVVELASPSDGTSRGLTALRRAAAPPLHGGERPARLCADAHLAARAIANGWRLERTGPVSGLL